jgi:hypothetical protein
MSPGVTGGDLGAGAAALGVFLWFEILHFDLLFSSAFHLVFLCWVVYCLCCLSDTEQHLMPACDVLFWNQVIKANQFFFPAPRPLTS